MGVEVKDPIKRVVESKGEVEEEGGKSYSEFDSKEEERNGAREGEEDDEEDKEVKESGGNVELTLVRGLCFQKDMTTYRKSIAE